MPNKSKSIMESMASLVQGKLQPQPQPSTLTPDYIRKNKQDIANTFQISPENDYNQKIRKALGLN